MYNVLQVESEKIFYNALAERCTATYTVRMESTRDTEGLVTTRFGPRGSPDRDALETLLKLGQEAKPVPVNANQMVRLAVREYVERHAGRPARAKKGAAK